MVDVSKRRRLTPTEMNDRKAQGLCYFCDKKYGLGHKCKVKRHLYSIELEKAEWEGYEEEKVPEEEEEMDTLVKDLIKNCEISLQALNGIKGYRTLRISGFTDKKPINILIDCGSTHNFINEQAAKRIGCRIQKISP